MKSFTATTTALFLLAALLAHSASAQPAQAQDCASKLTDCAGDLNSTKPSTKCCASLKDAVTNQLSCLCGLLQNKALINNFGINITQALELPKHCGITSDTSVCNNVGSPAAPASPSGTPSGTPTSVTPATPKTTGNTGAASANSVSSVAMYVLTSSLFFWWSIA